MAFYPELPMKQTLDPLTAGVTGLGAGLEVGNQALKSQALNEALQERREKQAALKQFAETKDPNALMGIDPELGIRVKAWLDSQPPENLKDITNATKYVQSIGPSINSRTWGSIRPEIEKAFPKLPKEALPPPNATDAQLFQYVNAAKLLDAQLKSFDPNYQLKVRKLEELDIPKAVADVQHKKVMEQHWANTEGISLERLKHDKTTIKEMADPKNPGAPPKLYLLNALTGDVIKELGDKGGQATRETVDFLARTGLYGGFKALPTMGFGPQIRGPVLNRMAEIAAKEDIMPEDVITRGVVRDTLKTGLQQMEGQAGKIEAFARNFDKNIGVVRDMLRKNDPRTGVPILNKWIQAGKRSVTGDPDISALDVGLKTIANEFSRLTTSATGGGQLAESEIKKAEALLSAAQTPEQMEAALQVMEKDKANRLSSFEEQRKSYQQRIQDLGKKPLGETAATPTVGGKSSSGAGTKELTAQDRQAYDAKLAQIQALPDGPRKQAALKQMQDLAAKWGIK